MFSVKQKDPSHKFRAAYFIREAVLPPLILISSSLINWHDPFSRANLIPGATLILLWLVAGIIVWIVNSRS